MIRRFTVEWNTEVTENYRAVVEIDTDDDAFKGMSPEEIMEAIKSEPHEYLPGEETVDTRRSADVMERDVESIAEIPPSKTDLVNYHVGELARLGLAVAVGKYES